MERLKSIDHFRMLRDLILDDLNPNIPTIIISAGTCGQASGANDLIRIAKRDLLGKGLAEKIQLRVTGCHGFCQMEPSVIVGPRGTFYPKLNIISMGRIVEAVAEGNVLDDLLYTDPSTGLRIEKQSDIPFFKKQLRTILARNQEVDPIRLYHYIQIGG